ncbi:TPA: hypothetical protein ACWLUJ_006161 [Pseudomonas aeruginosa]|nr:hypothetical protein [Pseudomonas aeruginosa]
MDLSAKLKEAGLEVISGNLRMAAALEAGLPAEATDDQGNTFRITITDGLLNVQKLDLPLGQEEFASSTAHSGVISPIQISQLIASPSNRRLTTYSFRAECDEDALQFLANAEANGFTVQGTVIPDTSGLPDVDVEIQTDATLAQLQDLLRRQQDAHVMLQTLRQEPLNDNSLERDYDLV